MKPITPAQIEKYKRRAVPRQVIQAFNQLIAERWDGSRSHVLQEDAVDRIIALMKPLDDDAFTKRLYDRHWLDIERLYRKVGWSVLYQPADQAKGIKKPYFDFTKG